MCFDDDNDLKNYKGLKKKEFWGCSSVGRVFDECVQCPRFDLHITQASKTIMTSLTVQ